MQITCFQTQRCVIQLSLSSWKAGQNVHSPARLQSLLQHYLCLTLRLCLQPSSHLNKRTRTSRKQDVWARMQDVLVLHIYLVTLCSVVAKLPFLWSRMAFFIIHPSTQSLMKAEHMITLAFNYWCWCNWHAQIFACSAAPLRSRACLDFCYCPEV